ncbi:MAG TPA: hypothetical protein DCM58_05625 [Desulfovibrio sp.]|nr:hypothetical protein [Desulfovibrio sp.]
MEKASSEKKIPSPAGGNPGKSGIRCPASCLWRGQRNSWLNIRTQGRPASPETKKIQRVDGARFSS